MHGSGDADRETADAGSCLRVPPEDPRYTLRRVWLTKEEEEGYYLGFSNEGLWPLCHIAHTRPTFRAADWEQYQRANAKFADALLEEMAGVQNPVVLVQDYHFALLPRLIKRQRPEARVAIFWHIPWPNPEVFRICPWKQDILRGMLGNDILGFHIRYYGDNFIATVDRELETRIDREQSAIIYRRHMTKIRAFPISIDFESVAKQAAAPATDERIACLRERYNLGEDMIVGVGADRIDYTKGLPERIEAVNRFLEKYPEYCGRLVFFQAGVPSRTHVDEYRRLNEEVDEAVRRVNQKYGTADWCPIIFRREHLPLSELLAWYRMARFAIVSSLHDGMNLVAKEGPLLSERGCALVLSREAGAAAELGEAALLVNPYDVSGTAQALHEALDMPAAERQRRCGMLAKAGSAVSPPAWVADRLAGVSEGDLVHVRRRVTTIDGVSGPVAEAVKAAWTTLSVPQCGYCQAGQIMSAAALLARNRNPSDGQIDAAMDGNLCRCGTYLRIRQAIRKAASIARGESKRSL